MGDESKGRSGWAIVSQMGHVTIAGFVTETTLAGHGVLSVAIPDGDRMVEKLIPPSTLYDLTWVGETEARLVAKKHPVQVIDDWTIRQEVRAQIEVEELRRVAQMHAAHGECPECGQDMPTDPEQPVQPLGVRQAPPETHFDNEREYDDDHDFR